MKKTNEDKIIELLEEIKGMLKPTQETSKPMQFEVCNGLMWSNTSTKEMIWNEAMEYAKNCRDGGYDDWRLPTVSELQSVFDYGRGKPKIDGFKDEYFWSSTERSNTPAYAWFVYVYDGYTGYLTKVTGTYYVRCVRRDS